MIPPYRIDVHNGDLSHAQLVQAAHNYLKTLGSTLWGQAFNIIDERDVAAEWLALQVKAVLKETR